MKRGTQKRYPFSLFLPDHQSITSHVNVRRRDGPSARGPECAGIVEGGAGMGFPANLSGKSFPSARGGRVERNDSGSDRASPILTRWNNATSDLPGVDSRPVSSKCRRCPQDPDTDDKNAVFCFWCPLESDTDNIFSPPARRKIPAGVSETGRGLAERLPGQGRVSGASPIAEQGPCPRAAGGRTATSDGVIAIPSRTPAHTPAQAA